MSKYFTYENIEDFLNIYVIRLQGSNPKAVRLDLLTAKDKLVGNRNIAGVFFYPEIVQDRPYRNRWVKWKVRLDTYFAPLVKAYSLICGGNPFPFIAGQTRTGKGTRLNLITSQERTPFLFIYKI